MITLAGEDDMEGKNNDCNGKVMPVLDDQDWIAMKVENIRKANWPYQSLESSQSRCRKEADTATAF